jgi:hypothetical protein
MVVHIYNMARNVFSDDDVLMMAKALVEKNDKK